MKKAEEYLEDYGVCDNSTHPNLEKREEYELRLAIIKQAQIDAIDATVKRCSKSARLTWYNNEEGTEYQINKYDSFIDDVIISIKTQSILKVAEELKKELE